MHPKNSKEVDFWQEYAILPNAGHYVVIYGETIHLDVLWFILHKCLV
jgi:hypothetical protein